MILSLRDPYLGRNPRLKIAAVSNEYIVYINQV